MGSCLALGNELSKETHTLTEQKTVLGRGAREENWGKEAQTCSAPWFPGLDFMVLGLLSGLSLNNHLVSGSFLVVHALISQNGFQGGFWEVGRTYRLASTLCL